MLVAATIPLTSSTANDAAPSYKVSASLSQGLPTSPARHGEANKHLKPVAPSRVPRGLRKKRAGKADEVFGVAIPDAGRVDTVNRARHQVTLTEKARLLKE